MKPATDNPDIAPVTVQILDKDYRIACTPDEQHGLMDCARMLDKHMRDVRRNGRVIGADRIAVMAALNVVYDLMQQRNSSHIDVSRLERLQQRVGDASESPPTTGVDARD